MRIAEYKLLIISGSYAISARYSCLKCLSNVYKKRVLSRASKHALDTSYLSCWKSLTSSFVTLSNICTIVLKSGVNIFSYKVPIVAAFYLQSSISDTGNSSMGCIAFNLFNAWRKTSLKPVTAFKIRSISYGSLCASFTFKTLISGTSMW